MDFPITVLQTILGFLSLFICTLFAAVVVCCVAAGCICGRAGLASAYTVRSASLDNTVKSQSESMTSFLSCLKTNLQSMFHVFHRANHAVMVAPSVHQRSNSTAK
jgi:hypothetical protein